MIDESHEIEHIAPKVEGLRHNDDILGRGLRRYKRTITAENWKPIHEKVLSYKILGMGTAQIARTCSISDQSVRNITKSPYFMQRLQEGQIAKTEANILDTKASVEEAKNILSKNIIPAVRKIAEIMATGESKDRIQLDAAQAILDRAGLAKSTIVENVSRNYSPEEIESAKNTLLEIESITARVTTSQSKFVLQAPAKEDITEEQDAVGEVYPTSSD